MDTEILPPAAKLAPKYDLFPDGVKVNGLAVKDDIHTPLSGKQLNELTNEALKGLAAAVGPQREVACTILRLLEEVMTSRDLRKALKEETQNGVTHSPKVSEALSRLDRKDEAATVVL